MTDQGATRLRKIGRVLAVVALVSVLFALIVLGLELAGAFSPEPQSPAPPASPTPLSPGEKEDSTWSIPPPILAILVSFLVFTVSAVGAASTIVLGWRSERRQAQEFKLKIEHLELQLAEARERATKSPKPK